MLKQFTVALAAIFMLAAGSAQAAEWGDPAAELSLNGFVKGDPITLAEGKGEKVFVVEFWATWCGPCRTSIPHLTELQKKYGDEVVIIGVSDETRDVVAPFVTDMGDTMNYRVAVDRNRETSSAYMGAYGQSGIPTAFIVDKQGRVAWVGHPGNMDGYLEDIVNGSYDVEAMMKEKAEAEAAMEQFESFLKIVETDTNDNAYALARKYLEDKDTHYSLLANAGWVIIQHELIKERDYDLSRALLEGAVEKSKKSARAPRSLYENALALACYKTGDLNAAIKHQKLAVELEEDASYRARFEQALEGYEAELVAGPSPSSL